MNTDSEYLVAPRKLGKRQNAKGTIILVCVVDNTVVWHCGRSCRLYRFGICSFWWCIGSAYRFDTRVLFSRDDYCFLVINITTITFFQSMISRRFFNNSLESPCWGHAHEAVQIEQRTLSAGGPVAFSTIVFVRRMARGAAYQSLRLTYCLFARLRSSFSCNTNQGHRCRS